MLLSFIQQHKQISRAQLATLTKMSNTSVGKIMNELIDDELVIEVGQTKGAVGRRATLLEINPRGLYIIGVEIQLHRVLVDRSEEHTSELQSRGHLVCRLLLEKKKKIQWTLIIIIETRYTS